MGKAQFRLTPDAACAIGSILYKGMLVEFLIDASDLSAVQAYRWHLASNQYIATSVRVDASGGAATTPKKREVYLHTFLVKPVANQTVIHISKNGLDNRRANLKLVEAAHATPSSAAKKRSIQLPPLCGIQPEDIPRHIWYVQANGYHRDRFAIEFKTEKILWKTTSSKSYSLLEKLQQAKTKLEELYTQYPHLDPKHEEEQAKALQATFEAAMSLKAPAAS